MKFVPKKEGKAKRSNEPTKEGKEMLTKNYKSKQKDIRCDKSSSVQEVGQTYHQKYKQNKKIKR